MKKVYTLILLLSLFLAIAPASFAAFSQVENDIGPIPCFKGACPPELPRVYDPSSGSAYSGETCVTSYEEFLVDPARRHFWAEDPEVTSQGKADERARQFIYWVVNHNAIDDHQALKQIWNATRNIAYFMVIIVATFLGMGFIISQRTNFSLKIKIWPQIWKILLALVYITFSAAIILLLIQLSEILMKFFIESLGGRDLFNIYFTAGQSSEANYTTFYGCRDLNIRSQEAADAEMMMLKLTNITYYVMGSMLLLRKILLWFLLFVSPFLAILMPFTFIRNTGWIWIGVFFQWLFYGPLFALFLGALAKIWKSGIPFTFDFSRRNTPEGYVYPTAIRILYGGPAQKLGLLNNANYIDTFVEYVLTLLMLWAVTFFPWWLLRIFRDYCCDVFAAANNVLVSMYDQMRAGSPITPMGPGPKGGPAPVSSGQAKAIPIELGKSGTERPIIVRLESIQEIKNAKTGDIMQSLNLSAPRLTDVARYETNKESSSMVKKNLAYLANPVKAQTPAERQMYMNIRTELFSRAIKEDKMARQILSSTSTSFVEQLQKKTEILKSTPQAVPMNTVLSSTAQMPQERMQSITTNLFNTISTNKNVTTTIAQNTQLSQSQVSSILSSYSQNLSKPTNQVVSTIAQETNTSKEKVAEVLKQAMVMTEQSQIMNQTATREHVSSETVQKLLQSLPAAITTQQVESVTNRMANNASITQEKAQSVVNNVFNSVTTNNKVVNALSKSTNLSEQQVKSVLNSYTQNMSQPANQTVTTISQQTNVSKEKVTEVLQKANTVMQQSAFNKSTIQKEQISSQTLSKVLETVAQTASAPQQASVTSVISTQTQMSQQQVNSVVQSMYKAASQDTKIISTVSQTTQVPAEKVQTIVSNYSQNMNQSSSSEVTSQISKETGVSREKVTEVMREVSNQVSTSSDIMSKVRESSDLKTSDIEKVSQVLSESVAPAVAAKVDLPVEKQQAITTNIFNSMMTNNTIMNNIQQQTGLTKNQVQNVMSTYTQNISQPSEVINERIHQAAGIEKTKVPTVMRAVMKSVSSTSALTPNLVKDIATKENIKAEDVKKVVEAQVPMLTEMDQQVEKTIPIPSTVSIEDYEEVKKMWTSQYEKGEVPMSDVIKSRNEWVDQDIVMITNTLNKLLSSDETMRREGLDDLGFILPIFMINNMKGDEMMVYLKAKLEAAKTVKKQEELKLQLTETPAAEEEEIFVDIKREGAEEAPKILHMELEQDVPASTRRVEVTGTGEYIEEAGESSLKQALSSMRQAPVFILRVEEIKSVKTDELIRKMDMFAQKLTDIARLETNRQTRETVNKHIEFIANPTKAESADERKTYEDIRTELSSRSGDQAAQHLLAPSKENLLKSVPQSVQVSDVLSNIVKVPQGKIQSVTSSVITSASQQSSIVNAIAQQTQIPQQQVQTILQAFTKNVNQPSNQVINTIVSTTNIPKEKVTQVLQQISNTVQQSEIIQSVAGKEQIPNQTVQNVLQTLTSPVAQVEGQQLVDLVVQATTLPAQAVNTVTQSAFSYIQNSPQLIQSIQTQTGLNQQQITAMLAEFAQNLNKPIAVTINTIAKKAEVLPKKVAETFNTVSYAMQSKEAVQSIAKTTKVEELNVEKIVRSLLKIAKEMIKESASVSQAIAGETFISEEKVKSVIISVINNTLLNETLMKTIQSQTKITERQVQAVLITYAQNVDQPSATIIERVSQVAGIEKTNVIPVLQTAMKVISGNITVSNDITKGIAAKEGVTESQVAQVFVEQVSVMIAPEKNIEKTVQIPAAVSIEDYEEVKNMWTQQYEKGEVPIGENISSRAEWIEKDIIILTNILNKLLSSDEKLRREALDEVGFLLPIFMINDLTGEELLVYLKAKLEAAKAVKKEEDVKAKLEQEKKPEEELVEVSGKKAQEKPKTMEMAQEMEIEGDDKKQT